MTDYLAYVTIGIVVILFFYFGYKDDYKRNPSEFKKTVTGVPIGILSSIFGLSGVSKRIKKWIKNNEK